MGKFGVWVGTYIYYVWIGLGQFLRHAIAIGLTLCIWRLRLSLSYDNPLNLSPIGARKPAASRSE
jgi:hypothetical protein